MPIIRIHNIETNEMSEREMNQEELAQLQKDIANSKAREEANVKAEKAKSNAQAKLEALGLTADDLKALGL